MRAAGIPRVQAALAALLLLLPLLAAGFTSATSARMSNEENWTVPCDDGCVRAAVVGLAPVPAPAPQPESQVDETTALDDRRPPLPESGAASNLQRAQALLAEGAAQLAGGDLEASAPRAMIPELRPPQKLGKVTAPVHDGEPRGFEAPQNY